MQKLVIVGGGAMGCLFAARLALGGNAVHVVDVDRAAMNAINRDGIRLVDASGTRRVAITGAHVTGADVGAADLVIIFVKGMHTGAAVSAVRHLADGNCHALTLQNGIGNHDALAAIFGPDRTLLGVTDQPADLTAPGQVHVPGVGHVRLGSLSEAGAAGATAAAVLLAGADFACEAIADPLVAVWQKAAFNAALNSVAAVCGMTVGEMDCPEGRRIATAIARETVATANALGIPADVDMVLAQIDFAMGHHRGHKASMLQDLIAGRATEIESINGAIVELADVHGVPVPVTATLCNLVRMIERRGMKPAG